MGARGLTMVELMVTLAVILLITAAASTAYVKLLGGVKVQGRITESQMDNLCGFELLRYDIEMAGFALPKGVPTGAPAFSYSEAVSSSTTPEATTFNDAPGIPRPFVFSNNTGQRGADDNASDVLVIKSMVANAKASNKKWSFIYHDGANWRIKAWDSAELNFSASNPIDRIIVLGETGALQRTAGNAWQFDFQSIYLTNATGLPLPATGGGNLVYAVISSDDNGTAVRMPFNRVDYYLKRPATNFPSRCFPGSFILYRGTINHGNGARNEQPLIDCVMDFQVTFGVDSNGDLAADTWRNDLTLADVSGSGPAEKIRKGVREVRVFVLVQEGQKDDNFRFSGTLNLGDAQIANDAGFQTLSTGPLAGAMSSFTPAGDAARYRWKVVKLAIKPMNLE